jgi:hypothetical protein
MLARVLSAALSAIAPGSATADVNRIEAFPVEVEVNSGWGDTVVVIVGLAGRHGLNRAAYGAFSATAARRRALDFMAVR